MNQKEIITTIQKRRALGLTDEQIRASLVNQGLSDEESNELIALSYKEPEIITEEIAKQEKAKEAQAPKKKKWWPF